MKGSVDLGASPADLQAVVALEISATVDVAAAFAVNPTSARGICRQQSAGSAVE